MSTALRLRTLADIIEINGLPDPKMLSISSGWGPASLHYDDRDAVDAWSAVIGQPVRVRQVRAGLPDEFTAHVTGNDAVTVVFYDHTAAQVSA